MTPDTRRAESLLRENLQFRKEASSWSLNKAYGLPIERVRKIMQVYDVTDTDKE